MITLQYLEPGPHMAGITPAQARTKLQEAFTRLPIECLLLGWDIPPVLADVCREVTASAGVQLYRWQPLLTGDGTLYPQKEWRTQNFAGQPLSGFRGLPEFTFICSHNPAARSAILTHITGLAQSGYYDGIFLDRMRYPSPAADLVGSLSCFCEHCHQAAQEMGLDLADVHQALSAMKPVDLLRTFFADTNNSLARFLDFRQQTITEFIREVNAILRSADLEIGLDCFSPTLARMVGQDLTALAPLADWTKIMLYGHAFGPATLPFELTDLLTWLTAQAGISRADALLLFSETIDIPLDAFIIKDDTILLSTTLADEYRRGRNLAPAAKLLAGIELVEMPGVSELHETQIEIDLRAFKNADADGLSLSWDLWHIPLKRLDLVSRFFSINQNPPSSVFRPPCHR